MQDNSITIQPDTRITGQTQHMLTARQETETSENVEYETTQENTVCSEQTLVGQHEEIVTTETSDNVIFQPEGTQIETVEYVISEGNTNETIYFQTEDEKSGEMVLIPLVPMQNEASEMSGTTEYCTLNTTEHVELNEADHNHINIQAVQTNEDPQVANNVPKLHTCHICHKQFDEQLQLRVHVSKHTVNRNFKCDVCGKAFTYRNYLKQHLRIHSGIKQFRCDLCGNQYSTKQVLQIHIRTHTGERPFECEYCHKAFTHVGALRVHQRVHTGEKPFQCDDCGAAFGSKPQLNRHYLTYHV